MTKRVHLTKWTPSFPSLAAKRLKSSHFITMFSLQRNQEINKRAHCIVVDRESLMARENTCIRNFESNDTAQSVPFSWWEKVQFHLSKKIHRKFHSNGKRSESPRIGHYRECPPPPGTLACSLRTKTLTKQIFRKKGMRGDKKSFRCVCVRVFVRQFERMCAILQFKREKSWEWGWCRPRFLKRYASHDSPVIIDAISHGGVYGGWELCIPILLWGEMDIDDVDDACYLYMVPSHVSTSYGPAK